MALIWRIQLFRSKQVAIDIVAELIKFGTDSIRVFGKRGGAAYIKRCLPVWAEQYGEAVAQQVRAKLLEEVRK